MNDGSKNWRYFLNRWISGEANRSDERSLEVLAKDDPFLADALEGYRTVPEADHARSVTKLKANLRKRTEKKDNKRAVFYLMRIAAVGVLLLGAWFVFRAFDGNNKTVSVVQDAPKTNQEITGNLAADSTNFNFNKKINSETAAPEQKDFDKKPERKLEQIADVSPKKESPSLAPPAVKIAPPPPSNAAADLAINEPKIAKDESRSLEQNRPEVAAAPIADLAKKRKRAEVAAKAEEAEGLTMTKVEEEAKAMPAPREGATNYYLDGVRVNDDNALAPQIIKGQITDENGDPLIGANVIINSSEQGTVTDIDGNFIIKSIFTNPEILVSYTGYTTQNIQAEGDRFLKIQMEEGAALSEVVVTELGRDKKAKRSKPSVPEPEIGFKKYKKYIQQNLQKPQAVLDSNIIGKVVLGFQIDGTGTPYNFEILRPLGHGCEEEAIRLLKDGPKWSKPTNDRQTYSFEFK